VLQWFDADSVIAEARYLQDGWYFCRPTNRESKHWSRYILTNRAFQYTYLRASVERRSRHCVCVCVCVCLVSVCPQDNISRMSNFNSSASDRSNSCTDGCRPNLVGMGKGWPSRSGSISVLIPFPFQLSLTLRDRIFYDIFCHVIQWSVDFFAAALSPSRTQIVFHLL